MLVLMRRNRGWYQQDEIKKQNKKQHTHVHPSTKVVINKEDFPFFYSIEAAKSRVVNSVLSASEQTTKHSTKWLILFVWENVTSGEKHFNSLDLPSTNQWKSYLHSWRMVLSLVKTQLTTSLYLSRSSRQHMEFLPLCCAIPGPWKCHEQNSQLPPSHMHYLDWLKKTILDTSVLANYHPCQTVYSWARLQRTWEKANISLCRPVHGTETVLVVVKDDLSASRGKYPFFWTSL